MTANPLMDANLNLNFTIRFLSIGYVHCTLAFQMSSPLDVGRYGAPAKLFFKVVPDAPTTLLLNVANLQFSSTGNTTNQLSISPTPTLIDDEYLEMAITGCTGQGGALSAGVTPVWGQTVRWGWSASTIKTVAVSLPAFTNGGLHSVCAVSLTGSTSALYRYNTPSQIHIRAGKLVQLSAELDLITGPVSMFNTVSVQNTQSVCCALFAVYAHAFGCARVCVCFVSQCGCSGRFAHCPSCEHPRDAWSAPPGHSVVQRRLQQQPLRRSDFLYGHPRCRRLDQKHDGRSEDTRKGETVPQCGH